MEKKSIEAEPLEPNSDTINGLVSVVENVKRYNSQYGIGGLIGRQVVERVGEALKHGEDIERLMGEKGRTEDEAELETSLTDYSDKRVPFGEEQEMAKAVLELTHSDLLEDIGLRVSALRPRMVVAVGESVEQAGELKFQLVNGAKFSAFLHEVKLEDVNEELRHALEDIARDLVSEIYEAFKKSGEDIITAEGLAYAGGIARGLERIGLDGVDVQHTLEKLSSHVDKGDAREWVAAHNIGLLREIGEAEKGFGPSTWHTDCSGQYLSEHWQKILSTLGEIKNNPRAQELFNDLVNRARQHLDYSRSAWHRRRSEHSRDLGDYGKDFDSIFERVGLELDVIES